MKETTYKKSLKTMASAGLVGIIMGTIGLCGPTNYPMKTVTGHTIKKMYAGETFDYNVRITERYTKDQCISRDIELKALNKLHIIPVVEHVKATDQGCDESFEYYYFRNVKDQGVSRRWLTEELLNAYYPVRYGR